jgi:hypothetical protein
MNNLNDTLPDLMRRATENLEPDSTDLVERGMRRGVTLRRRRTVLRGLTGATAVLATAGIVVSGTQLFGGHSPAGTPDDAPAAGGATASAKAPTAKTVTPADTLNTLTKLLPANLKQSDPKSFGSNGMHHAEVVVNDGKGASLLTVEIVTTPKMTDCSGTHGNCTVRKDGSVVVSYANESIFPYEPAKNPEGVKNTVLEIFRPDGKLISIYSYNAPKQINVQHTRVNPLFSVADLTRIATSDQWVYPAKYTGPGQPDPRNPGTGKPTVPVAQTLMTLKKVLPGNLQFSRPETWGGGKSNGFNGFNGAAYVINDGKGASRVDVGVTYEIPVTKCSGEGPQQCKVRSDGAVVGWSTESPVYSDSRQAINGVVSNSIEIHYPDGRNINMTSYNGPQEKDAKHTRVHPAFSTDQLISMAGSPDWKFPGTGKK